MGRALKDRLDDWLNQPAIKSHRAMASLAYLHSVNIRPTREMWFNILQVVAGAKDPQGTAGSLASSSGNNYGDMTIKDGEYVAFNPEIKEYACSLQWKLSPEQKKQIMEIVGESMNENPSYADTLKINLNALSDMKKLFLKAFPDFKSFQQPPDDYRKEERDYKDELKAVFDEEILPLLQSNDDSTAALIPNAIDETLKHKLQSTGKSQNIIHWLTWEYLSKLDEDASRNAGHLFRSLVDETQPLQQRLDSFEADYTKLMDENVPAPKGKRSWQGILRPLTSFILSFTFPEKYIFVRTEVFKRTSELLINDNICADYTSGKSTLGREYTKIMEISRAIQKELADWQPKDFIDIQSFFWIGAPKNREDVDDKKRECTAPPVTTIDYQEPEFDSIKQTILQAGLILDLRTIRRYYLSLKSRKFVILAGVSGTGKTWLAEQYARAVDAEHLIVQVAPNWTSNEDLLGFHSPVTNTFQPTDFTSFLEKACEAQNEADRAGLTCRPFHLILDEMNLARVEHYFARFLSAMELRQRHKVSRLFLGPNTELYLPDNLHFIGTVNIDETTYGFADKVFDRAQLIELPLNRDLIASILKNKTYSEALLGIWDAVKDVAPFAFRVLDDIESYINASENINVPWSEALDEMLVQKILPKIKGNDSRLADVFDKLLSISEKYSFPLMSEKISYMRTCYHEHGFTSFFC